MCVPVYVMANSLPSTDIVFIDTLNFSVNIGYDCWGKDCAHPVGVSVYLHLQPNFLHNAGQSDDVTDSVHYGHLTKSIGEYFKNIEQDWSSFNGVDALIEDVAEEGFKLGGAAVAAVHVVLSLPKFILLADGFEMDAVVEKSGERCQILGSVKVSIKDVVLPVLIGVNPPEREAKQRVVTNIIVYEPDSSSIDYQGLMDKVTKVCVCNR